MFSDEVLRGVRAVQSQYKRLDLTKASVLAANLTLVWHIIAASENLLRVASEFEHDTELKQYFKEHLKEESQHQAWLAADLATLGVEPAKTSVPRIAVELVGSQYYLIQHVDPAALLGYMVVLECTPTPLVVIDELERIHGREAVRTLRYHATHDLDHGKDVLAAIDALEPTRQWIVEQSALQSARYLGDAMAAIT